jgi:SAM-dependent methyltransferase
MDRFIILKHPEWRSLPPASLRMRIGVGNRILRNHRYFVESGQALIDELSDRHYLTRESEVLELGCGCGRNAFALKRFLRQEGSYVGQDVDRNMISWCQNHLQERRFVFHHADVFSAVYNPKGRAGTHYRFPLNEDSVTLIISVSVFSHLLYGDFSHYVTESSRVLTPGGCLHMTLFLMDYLKARLGSRWSFRHRLDHCYVENLRYPEAAVAYDLDVVKALLKMHQFSILEVYNLELHQQTLVAKKA